MSTGKTPKRIEVATYWAKIYVGGDFSISDAERISRDYCDEVGLCVTINKTRYLYTNGGCDGVEVGLINYGRFPECDEVIFEHAEVLAMRLVIGLGQESASIVAKDKTVWISYREHNNDD